MNITDIITDVERYGDKGWTWTIDWPRVDHGAAKEYRTDGDGDGMWSRTPSSGDYAWKQGLGHLQFRLRATTEADARRAIERHWAKR